VIFFRFIRAISLLVAGLAIIAHMIIPHDHHYICPENGTSESCPVSQEKSTHHPVFPAHCHAFSDLAAEKFTPLIQKQDNSCSIALVKWYPDNLIPALYSPSAVFTDNGRPVPEIHLCLSSPFRAPPVQS
jgi:hypothetical protein